MKLLSFGYVKALFLLFLALGVADALLAEPPDAIDRLVAKLSATHGMWINGLAPNIFLPETASPQQVLDRVFKMVSLGGGRISNYTILKIRRVYVDGSLQGLCIATLVRTNLGEEITILYYEGPKIGWWARIYSSDQL